MLKASAQIQKEIPHAVFISDVHLMAHKPEGVALFIETLKKIQSLNYKHVFLVGDIFDIWIGGHKFFSNRFSSVVQQIQSMRKAGIEIYFFEGNHDIHLRPYWSETLGAYVYQDGAFFKIAGQTVYVDHGDLMNPEDRSYQRLRKALRSIFIRLGSLWAPGGLTAFIGDNWSRISRKRSHRRSPEIEARILKMMRTFATRFFSDHTCDWIVTGHTHIKDIFVQKINNKEKTFINLGSWHEGPQVFILEEKQAQSRGYFL